MQYKVKTAAPSAIKSPCLVVGVFAKRRLSAAGEELDQASAGALSQTLKFGDIEGEIGDSQMLYQVPGCKCERVLLLGLGDPKELKLADLRKAAAEAVAVLNQGHSTGAVFHLDGIAPVDGDPYRTARDLVLTAEQTSYRFDQLKSDPKPPKRPLREITLAATDPNAANTLRLAASHGKAAGAGVNLARDLGNLPGNVCTPSYLAEQALAMGKANDRLSVEVLEEKDMEKLGMGALLSVSRGSRQPAKLIVMNYRGGKTKAKPIVLVGKGLTFDAGGISIKQSAGMDEMKFDMCGGASVFGTIAACLELKLPLNVVGVVPASENLPDGDANKPGDIVTSMSGQTIEVLNTDAEGRLILCDALTYSERFKPELVVDMATLTGACVVALGQHASGLFSADDELADELLAAGQHSGDRAWRLPLWDDYQKLLDSNFADMANIGGKYGGAITAACFLARYTKKYRWAHLDIAGAAWLTGEEKGATGRPVPLLTQFLLRRSGKAG